jgi:hypothetical protein
MPRMSPKDFDAFLFERHNGVIATLRRDGSPYTVPIWWLWQPAEPAGRDAHGYLHGVLWLTGTYSRVWCRQLLRDPRASLCIESSGPLVGHVEFDGLCQPFELPGFDIWPISRELALKYVGRGDPANAAAVEAFVQRMMTEPRLLFRLSPRVVRAIDMRTYAGKRADREYQARTAPGMAARPSR